MAGKDSNIGPMVALNRARGDKTRKSVWDAIAKLGIDADGKHRRFVVAETGINEVSVGNAMKAIRNGWKPEDMV